VKDVDDFIKNLGLEELMKSQPSFIELAREVKANFIEAKGNEWLCHLIKIMTKF